MVLRILRRLATALIRGPDAEYIRADLDEGFERDRARGVGRLRTHARYALNLLGSAWHARSSGARLPGISLLDVKLGWRMLWKHPLLTCVALFSLAVGIPVGLTPVHMTSALEAHLPIDEGDRIRGVRYARGSEAPDAVTGHYDYVMLRDALTTFGEMGAAREREYNLDPGDGIGAPVEAAEVTASTFSILRARPLHGRMLQVGDEEPGAPRVVVLGYDVWQSRFAGDPDAVGTTVRVAGVPYDVVGVMRPEFRFPAFHQLWLPLTEEVAEDFAMEPGGGPSLLVFGRLVDGATAEEAQAELTALGRRMALEFHETYDRLRAEVVPFAVHFFGLPKGGMMSEPEMRLFQLFMLLLLVVACANVALLIFARTATRSEELAVRTALGASRGRIVVQVFTEALVMAVLAAGLGLLLIDVVPNRLLAAMWPPEWGGMPYWIDMGVTGATVLQALVLGVVSAAVAAVVPSLRVTGKQVQRNIQQARAGRFGVRFGGLSTALVVADLALAVAVVGVTVGIADRMGDVRSAHELEGFPDDEYLAVELTLPDEAATGPDGVDASVRTARLAATQKALVERLTAEPGVRGVGVASVLPRMDHGSLRVEVEAALAPPDGHVGLGGHVVETARVDPGFFDALDQPILAGRGFGPADLEGDRTAVIVNAGFVENVLGGENPIGRRLRSLPRGDGEPGPWHEVVGLMADLGMDLIDQLDQAGVYFPAAPGEIHPLRLAVHVGPDPTALAPRVRALAAEVDPMALVAEPVALDSLYPEDWYLMIGMMVGWSLFVAVLVALVASGIYAIMAFAVTQRTREIGVRTALGARPAQIAATVGRRAAIQLAAGTILGMPLAGRAYLMVKEDPEATGVAFLVAVIPGLGIMLLVGLLACTTPLLRALRITPTEAMRGAG